MYISIIKGKPNAQGFLNEAGCDTDVIQCCGGESLLSCNGSNQKMESTNYILLSLTSYLTTTNKHSYKSDLTLGIWKEKCVT